MLELGQRPDLHAVEPVAHVDADRVGADLRSGRHRHRPDAVALVDRRPERRQPRAALAVRDEEDVERNGARIAEPVDERDGHRRLRGSVGGHGRRVERDRRQQPVGPAGDVLTPVVEQVLELLDRIGRARALVGDVDPQVVVAVGAAAGVARDVVRVAVPRHDHAADVPGLGEARGRAPAGGRVVGVA